MSDIDLTGAVEAGINARRAAYFDGRMADQCAAAAVTAAAPLIEKQVRAEIVAKIEARLTSLEAPAGYWIVDAYTTAARIARGNT